MKLSPDTELLLDAISLVYGGACILPEDIDDAVSHTLTKLGKCACVAGKSPKEKRAFLIGYAERIKDENSAV